MPTASATSSVRKSASRKSAEPRLLENTHPGMVPFSLEDGDGRPSRWNTLRALRVLRWYEQTLKHVASSADS